MFPLRDNIPSRTIPFVNYTIIGLCLVVFLGQLADQQDSRSEMIEAYGMTPARITRPNEQIEVPVRSVVETAGGQLMRVEHQVPAVAPPFSPWLTLLTCIFLHGGLLHFVGNVWFLWIFGDNVEDRFGHLGYAALYLIWGVAASAAHLATNYYSTIPTIGASGAIAGVMGAYLVLYPNAKVVALVPLFVFVQIMVLPAWVFLGLWLVLQLFQGVAAFSGQSEGIAWWAHIGGFAAGAALAWILNQAHGLRPEVPTRRPGTDRVTIYRKPYGRSNFDR